MAELESYEGSCHCGSVRYRVKADLSQVLACNCSICSRSGALLTFVPPSQFELLSGADGQTDYQFKSKNIHHLFCSTCGIKSFAHGIGPSGSPMYAINVRCLGGVDVSALSVMPFDGKSL